MPSLDPPEVKRKQKQILAENKYFHCIGEPCDYVALIVSNISFAEQITYL